MNAETREMSQNMGRLADDEQSFITATADATEEKVKEARGRPAVTGQRKITKILDKSILIVDDDARMLCALDKVLTGEGAVVTCTGGPADAVAILTGRQKAIDLIITDLWMPFDHGTGMTVISVVHEIFPTLPVIVLTAFGSPEVKAECLRQGAMAFLEKPLDTRQLLTAIDRALASASVAQA
jgi:DNA-binding NtrC family response regulator